MKTKIKHIITSIVLVITMSCNDYIDIVPDDVATFDLVFNNRANAKQFFYTLYGYLPHFSDYNDNPALFGGDEAWTEHSWNTQLLAQGFQNVSSPYFDDWGDGDRTTPHIALRDINIFLERIGEVRDIEEAERTLWIAEAKFLKTFYHFQLLRMYGPIPIIDENIEVSEDILDVRQGRDTVDDVIDYIIPLLDEAIADLPNQVAFREVELGRATKPIAAMLKAKILAYAASPLLNGNSIYAGWTNSEGTPYINQTFDANKWQLAADACKEAIDIAHEGGHVLYTFPTAGTAFADETYLKMNLRGALTDDWTDEIIWGQRNPTTATVQNAAFIRVDPEFVGITAGQVNSFYEVPLHIAEQFYSENGVPIEEDTTYDYAGRFDLTTGDADNQFYVEEGYETINFHLNRSPRFYASIGGDGILSFYDAPKDDGSLLYTVNSTAGGVSGASTENRINRTGYWPKKLVNYETVLTFNNYANVEYTWPVYRLADLYLLYSECLNEAQGPSADVFTYLDLVRDRSGMDGVETSWSTYSSNPSKPTTKDGLREIIHQERLVELAFEGHRFWDMKRWFKSHLTPNRAIVGWSHNESLPANYYTQQSVGIAPFSIKDYFWPISEEDLLANPNLDQSFGW